MTYQYHSNGKLLLTGEYLVLQGAEAIALPLKKGQTLRVAPISQDNQLIWKSIYNGKVFFEAVFSAKDLHTVRTNNEKLAAFIENLLKKAIEYIPALHHMPANHIEATLEFPLEWGLGSSSTLIANLSEWFNINPFRLNRDITNGSGYDIACARSERTIIYQLIDKYPEYREIKMNLPFTENLYFVYTGKKQSSKSEVKRFRKEKKDHSQLFPRIKKINAQIIHSKTLREFEQNLVEHEEIISSVMNEPPIQQKVFRDFDGVVKSLGAWGGDFILVTWEGDRDELRKYFETHNMEVIFTWDELVKNKPYERGRIQS